MAWFDFDDLVTVLNVENIELHLIFQNKKFDQLHKHDQAFQGNSMFKEILMNG